ncbi:MAG: hypothetical protein Q9197_002495 [Variospora fuerteventurae]
MADVNPLLQALPPAVDYLSYLTIVEYNLNGEQLSVLHEILQDTTLTANIGWDLVHLLLPLLPQSQPCLQDVARLGNPREVVLKVTELLEGLRTGDKLEDDQEEGQDQKEMVVEESGMGGTSPQHDTTPASNDDAKAQNPPSKESQFRALLDMLAILHPRIKTKYPSRFLSTSLQSVLSAYASLLNDDEQATDAVLSFIKSFAGSKRPRLPPRKSSTHMPVQPEQGPLSAPDPEASEEPVAPEEQALQQRLLQSFLTFAVEGYMSALPSEDEEVVAMAWSSRLQEQLHPEKNIPGKRTMREAFEEDEQLHRRDSTMGQMLALARDLHLTPDELVKTLTEPEDLSDDNLDDLPSSASDVPLSRSGCLHLLCATIASNILFHAPSTIPSLSIFPAFSSLLNYFLGDPSSGIIGTQSASSLIDSLLFLGIHTLETSGSITKAPEEDDDDDDDDTFTNTLQRLSLISANTPSAPLRYHAHLLTSRLLHAHPNANLRLSFIKDTLQHCPYETLKASAVGWLKDEILLAAAANNNNNNKNDTDKAEADDSATISIFTTPARVLEICSPYLFHNPSSLAAMSHAEFLAHRPFFLAVLNLCYFFFLLLLPRPHGCSRSLSSLGMRMGEENKIEKEEEGKEQEEGEGRGGYEAWLEAMEKRVQSIIAIMRDEEEEGGEGEGGEEEGMALMEGLIAMCKEKKSSSF